MNFFIRTFFFYLLFITNLLATPAAIQSLHYLDLRDLTGKSFLQNMVSQTGIVQNFESDFYSEYEFAGWEAVKYAIDNFDDKNKHRVLRAFDYDYDTIQKFTEALQREEKSFTPGNISDKIGDMLWRFNLSGDKYALGHFYAIASRAGTLIRIDGDNYYYNIGYYGPEVRSGRSYGATEHHNANDASHLMYLRELEKFFQYRNDYKMFFTAIMRFLVDTDVSVYKEPEFNDYAKAVLTDYITVYTAELRRHLMRNLSPWSAPWGNDMSEATFLSLFNVKSGLMNLEDGLVERSIKEHWALSKTGSGRSGFGINRSYRRALQADISNYFRYNEDFSKRVVAKRIDDLIGQRSDGDIYRGVMEYLNHERNLSNSWRVEQIEDELVEAFIDFLMAVYEDTEEISAYLKN